MQNLQCNILVFQLQKSRSLSFSPEHMKYHAKWKQSSFWTTGIWPTNRMNVDHNLFNPSKAYQSLEVTDNSENDILNFNVESENDVNNQLLQSTNLTAMDCPSISTDNQVKNEKNSQNFLHEIYLNKVNCQLFAVLEEMQIMEKMFLQAQPTSHSKGP